MKKLLILFAGLYLLSGLTSGQMITTDPALPVPGKVIKIYYDATKDAGSMHNYTADLYAHTGVTIAGGKDWQNVIGTWAVNSTQPKLTYLGDSRYELDITPDINTFYSLSSSTIVAKICLVIRNSDASKQTSPDVFIDVFQPGLNGQFISPAKTSIVSEINKQFTIKASASQADSVSLYLNGSHLKSGISVDQLSYTYLPSQYGEFLFKLLAWKNSAFVADSFFCYVRKPIISEALPDGLQDGINYLSDTSVALVLHAPYKSFVFTEGDFNGWRAGEKGYMKKTPDGERYWIQINGLIPGKEYRFQYFVDTTLYIGDPYTAKILDPANDPYINSATYPNLMAYPKDNVTGIVSVLQTAKPEYSWKTTGYNSPEKTKLSIYELLVRDFTAAHDYKTLSDTLGYLQKLGINAIELMPITEFEGNSSWGYNPIYYFAPDKYYGPESDLKAFIDNCHSRGIAVIMDMVLNHSSGPSPMVQLYLDYYGTDQIYMKIPNPWFNASSPNPLYKWGADFNHESPSTQAFVDRITSYWLTEYKIDGFRFDFTKGFTNTPGDGGGYDPARIAILKRMADKIWKVNPAAYVILEHFGANSEEKELAEYGMMPWGNNTYNYEEAAMGYTSDLTAVSYLGRGWDTPNLVSYMESHDEERLMFKTITYGASSGSYDTKELSTAISRMKLDALFFLTVPGPKMIWQFGELGYDISIDNGGRVSEKPVKWDYFSDISRHGLYQFYSFLNDLRKSQPVFSTSDFTFSLASTVKQLVLSGGDMKVNILGNFGTTPTKVDPSFPQTGKWYEFFTGDSINVTGVHDLLDFQPGEYRMYSTNKIPSQKLIIGVHDQTALGKNVAVSAYPNPSSGEFTLKINSPFAAITEVRISDITGRLVRQLRSPSDAPSTQLLLWDGKETDGSNAPSGIYIVHVKSGQGINSIKVVKQ